MIRITGSLRQTCWQIVEFVRNFEWSSALQFIQIYPKRVNLHQRKVRTEEKKTASILQITVKNFTVYLHILSLDYQCHSNFYLLISEKLISAISDHKLHSSRTAHDFFGTLRGCLDSEDCKSLLGIVINSVQYGTARLPVAVLHYVITNNSI